MEGLSDEEKFAYANSFGTPSFAQAVLLSIFGDHLSPMLQQCCLDAVATPGGSGALSLTFEHYANPGETILLPNHMWENYLNLSAERGLKSSVYRLFDETGHFDFDGLKKKAEFILKHQKRVLILLNDPCENPTGFCMEDRDYDALLDMARNDPEHDYVFAMDIAYFDFYDVLPEAKNADTRIMINILEDETTDISNVNHEIPVNHRIYDLQGRSVSHPSKGLYISGGHKFIIRK
jgi:aspartate/tyrosine/aromatic aminotransferase